MIKLWRHSLIGVGALALLGCGGAEPEFVALAADAGEVTAEPTVAVVDNDFEPAELVIEAGTEVTWEWHGDAAHDVVGPDFASDLQSGGTYVHTFDESGTYTYVCEPHTGMTGTVHVVP